MPERARVRYLLAEEILGHSIYWDHQLACPPGAQMALDEADERYRAVVMTVNWNRIVIQAAARCDHRPDGPEWLDPAPCGKCVLTELLVL